jgi:hypothetical protein
LLQENGMSICSSGTRGGKQFMSISGIEPTAFILEVSCPNHYPIDDRDFFRVRLIQYKIENLSLKPLQMEKVGRFFLRGNEPSSNPPNPSEKRTDPDEIARI